MSRDYPRLGITDFGKHLLDSGDLDPVYIALHKAELPDAQLKRWLLAYWCFYHCGVASYISERGGGSYWDAMIEAASNKEPAPHGGRWERGHERRHFRGAAAVSAVSEMSSDQPEGIVKDMIDRAPSFQAVSAQARLLPLFGPWISFKVCDMLDRVLGVTVDMEQAHVFMFKEPREAALMLWRQEMRLPANAKPKSEETVLEAVVDELITRFEDYQAPPLYDRAVGLPEVETILCKWKSHLNGHYPDNNDIDEIGRGLKPWLPHSETARVFASCMPRAS